VNVDLGIWGKLTRVVAFLLCVAFLLGVAVWYLPLIKQNERMRRVVLQLDTQIAKSEENNRQLKTSIEALRYDPKAVERLARERLGYAKPGETMIHFDEAMANNSGRR
jgi:cell division protein FtsB